MAIYRRIRLGMWSTLVFLSGVCFIGCESHGGLFGVDRCADIPKGAMPATTGTFACQWQTAQINRAQQDHYVIYQNEWFQDGPQLGPYGQQHATRLAATLPVVPYKVVIEPKFDQAKNAFDTTLDHARRDSMVHYLESRGIDDAENRVVIAYPIAEGLSADEGARAGAIVQGGGGQGNNLGGFGGANTGSSGFGATGVSVIGIGTGTGR